MSSSRAARGRRVARVLVAVTACCFGAASAQTRAADACAPSVGPHGGCPVVRVPPCAAGLGEAGAAGKLLQFFTPDGAAPATQPTALALCWTPTHLWLGALLDGSADPAGLADAECAGSVGELEHDDSVAVLLSPGLANSSGWAYGAVGRGEGGEGGRHVVANVKGKGHTGRVRASNSLDCAAEWVLASVTPRQGVRGGWRASLAMPWGLFTSDDHYPIYG